MWRSDYINDEPVMNIAYKWYSDNDSKWVHSKCDEKVEWKTSMCRIDQSNEW